MGHESFCPCVLYTGMSGWNVLPMGYEPLFSCVWIEFCTEGRQDEMLCL